MSVQRQLDTLKESCVDRDWENQPNTWLRNLNSRHLSEIAIRLVHLLVGGQRSPSNSLGHKIWANEKLIDVKVATMSRISGNPSFAWRNIHFHGLCTHLALVAVYPRDTRLFLAPLPDIPAAALNRVKGSIDHFQIVTTQAFSPPQWLEKHEIVGEP